MAIRATLPCCILVAVCAGAWPQPTYDLRTVYYENQVILVQDAVEMEMTVPDPGIGGPEGLDPGQYRNVQVSEIRYRVLELKDGLPALQRTYVVRAQETDEMPGMDAHVTTSGLVGKVVLIRSASGKPPAYTFANGEPVDPGEAQHWLGGAAGRFARALNPRMAAMKVGDEIVATPTEAREILGLQEGEDGEFSVRLAEVAEEGEAAVAKLTFHAVARRAPLTGVVMRLDLAGTCHFRLARKRPDLVEGEGTIRVVAVTEDGAETGPVAEGTMKARTVYAEMAK